jgi:Tannase and feruloyl esterase/Beta-L-arabinofuranosidase, GH127
MYPQDFDGIVAGSPGAYWIGRETQAIWVAQAVHQTPESEIPAEKYRFIHESVLKACDRLDGLEDGVIEDPTECHFDPKTIACKSGDAPDCLTAPQVEAAQMLTESVMLSCCGAVLGLLVERDWKAGDVIELTLPMAIRRVEADPRVKEDAGRMALERGPLVYCVEWPDNGSHVHNLIVPDNAALRADFRGNLLNGVAWISRTGLANRRWIGLPSSFGRNDPQNGDPFGRASGPARWSRHSFGVPCAAQRLGSFRFALARFRSRQRGCCATAVPSRAATASLEGR